MQNSARDQETGKGRTAGVQRRWTSPWIALLVGILATLLVAFWGRSALNAGDLAILIVGGVIVSAILLMLASLQSRRGAWVPGRLRAALDEIKENEARRAAILDSALDCIITMDHEGRIVDFNPAAERTFGYTRQEVVGKLLNQTIIPPELRHAHEVGLRRYLESGEARVLGRRIEMPAMRADRTTFLSELTITTTRLPGRPPFFTGYLRDITERKRAEESLRASEEQYRASFELVAVGKAQAEPETGLLIRVNRKLCEITGYAEHELLSMTFPQLTHPDEREADFAEYQRLVRGELSEYAVEKRYIRKDGRVAWVSVNTAAVRDSHGRATHTVSVIQDITERKRVEDELGVHRERLEELVAQRTRELEQSHQRLRLSERMAALGTLSAGLGHDMGNLLLPLRLRLDSMESKGVRPETREDLEAIRTCADYMQRLANGLRLFALDPESPDAGADRTNLQEWWPDVHLFFKNALPRSIVLDHHLPDGLPHVRMARASLTQAVFNLVQNAGDALAGREYGRVTVWARPGDDERSIKVAVTDDGPGMAPDVAGRCLEPFFTTKTRGISTGLGLALVHGIVQKAGGSIDLETEVGKGATFTLTLPAVAVPATGSHVAKPRHLAVVSLTDDRMRAYVASILDSLGFDAVLDGQPDSHDAVLWITGLGDGVMKETGGFVASRRDRRVIVFGKLAMNPDPVSVVELDPAPRPAVIRQVLREVTAQISEST